MVDLIEKVDETHVKITKSVASEVSLKELIRSRDGIQSRADFVNSELVKIDALIQAARDLGVKESGVTKP